MSSAPQYSSCPILLSAQSKTKEKFDHGSAINGVHKPKWARTEVWLEVATQEGYCHSCHCYAIHQGEVYGQSDRLVFYCQKCIVIPSWARICRVRFGLKRGAHSKEMTAVTSRNKFKAYLRELKAQDRPIYASEISPIPQRPVYIIPTITDRQENERINAEITARWNDIPEEAF
jgi:hypothetical protein